MKELQKKLNDCNKCPFDDYEVNWPDEDTGYGKLGAHIYPNSDNSVMIVGQNPSHRRRPGEHSMKGHQGDPFREVFGKDKLVFTNFIQVSTPDNKVDSLTNEQIKHCVGHLLDEIEYLKPKVIIVCSAFAKKKLEEIRMRLGTHGAKVFFMKHPDYYMTYHRGDLEEYYQELRKIKETCF